MNNDQNNADLMTGGYQAGQNMNNGAGGGYQAGPNMNNGAGGGYQAGPNMNSGAGGGYQAGQNMNNGAGGGYQAGSNMNNGAGSGYQVGPNMNNGAGGKNNTIYVVVAVVAVALVALFFFKGNSNGGGLLGGSNTVNQSSILNVKNSKFNLSVKVNSVDKNYTAPDSQSYIRVNVTVTNNSNDVFTTIVLGFTLLDANKSQLAIPSLLYNVSDGMPQTIASGSSETFSLYYRTAPKDNMLIMCEIPGRSDSKNGVSHVYTDEFYIKLD